MNINDTASLLVDATLTPSVPHEFNHRHQSTAAPNCVTDALITSVLRQRPRELGCRSGPTTSAVARPGALRRGVLDGAAGRCGRRGRREAAGAGVAGRGTVGGRPVPSRPEWELINLICRSIQSADQYVDEINLQMDLICRSDPSGD